MNEDYNSTTYWLVGCPVSDGNFKSKLKEATIEDLEIALNLLPLEKTVAKRKILESKLKKLRQKALT